MKHVGLGRLFVVAAGCVFLATGDLASQEASFSIVTLGKMWSWPDKRTASTERT